MTQNSDFVNKLLNWGSLSQTLVPKGGIRHIWGYLPVPDLGSELEVFWVFFFSGGHEGCLYVGLIAGTSFLMLPIIVVTL